MTKLTSFERTLLKTLHWSGISLTTRQLVEKLGQSRATVRRYLGRLGRRGLLRTERDAGAPGRPAEAYVLSDLGKAQFPAPLTPLSAKLLDAVIEEEGGFGLEERMRRIGREVASEIDEKLADLPLPEKVRRLSEILDSLAYDAQPVFTGQELPGEAPTIEASNCIHHSFARDYPEVCEFDRTLLATAAGSAVQHERCILRGDLTCRFRFAETRTSAQS